MEDFQSHIIKFAVHSHKKQQTDVLDLFSDCLSKTFFYLTINGSMPDKTTDFFTHSAYTLRKNKSAEPKRRVTRSIHIFKLLNPSTNAIIEPLKYDAYNYRQLYDTIMAIRPFSVVIKNSSQDISKLLLLYNTLSAWFYILIDLITLSLPNQCFCFPIRV